MSATPIRPASPWWAERRARYHHVAPLVLSRSVLDVGCGSAHGTQLLHDAGAASAVGVDVDVDALRLFRRRADGARLVLGDGELLPIRSGAVDVAVAFDVLTRSARPEALVDELRRTVRPGGTAFVSVPNAAWEAAAGRTASWPPAPAMDPDAAARLARRAFDNVDLFGQTAARPSVWDDRPRSRWRRLVDRAPDGLTERTSRLVRNRPLHPGEHEFRFAPLRATRPHVVLLVCR